MRGSKPPEAGGSAPAVPPGQGRKAHVEPLPPPTPMGKCHELSTTTPQKGRASPYTVDDATMQPCRVAPPASPHHTKNPGRGRQAGLPPQYLRDRDTKPMAPQAGWSPKQSASEPLPSLRCKERLPGFPPHRHKKTRPLPILSMMRPRLGVAPLPRRPSRRVPPGAFASRACSYRKGRRA